MTLMTRHADTTPGGPHTYSHIIIIVVIIIIITIIIVITFIMCPLGHLYRANK